MFTISIDAVQHDPYQWPEPTKFIPMRFDADHPKWSKTADGKQRNPLAFGAFTGGKRVCLGKTLAETITRYTIPLLYYHFDFKFGD